MLFSQMHDVLLLLVLVLLFVLLTVPVLYQLLLSRLYRVQHIDEVASLVVPAVQEIIVISSSKRTTIKGSALARE